MVLFTNGQTLYVPDVTTLFDYVPTTSQFFNRKVNTQQNNEYQLGDVLFVRNGYKVFIARYSSSLNAGGHTDPKTRLFSTQSYSEQRKPDSYALFGIPSPRFLETDEILEVVMHDYDPRCGIVCGLRGKSSSFRGLIERRVTNVQSSNK